MHLPLMDEEDHKDITKVSRESLEQQYLFQLHCLGLIVLKYGPKIVLDKSFLEEFPRDVRLYFGRDEHGNIALEVKE